MFENLRDDAPLRTMAYTLFGLLYVLWLFNFVTKIVYVVPRSPEGAVPGQFYVLYLIAVTKFSDMGAYLTGSVIGKHMMVPHISPKKTWEGFVGALFFSLIASWGLLYLMPEQLAALNWTHATILGLLLGFAAVIGDLAESHREAQHGREGFREFPAGHRRRARSDRQPAVHGALVVLLSAARHSAYP